jgi:hypothetical protein
MRKSFVSAPLAACILFFAMALGMAKTAAAALPCDILSSAGTPCVGAYSTTRALFAAYNGALYQVKRASDSTTTNISTLSAGGYANAATQNSFCSGTTCIITELYDQTAEGNNLPIEGPGQHGKQDAGANATALPISAGGHNVYGVYIAPGDGYRNDKTKGVATNGKPEGMYMVTSGTHYNAACCFDFGNAETDNDADGAGAMDTVNFSSQCYSWGDVHFTCYGNGPWVEADLEAGVYFSGVGDGGPNDTSDTGMPYPFVTAILLNNGQTDFALLGGNAQSGGLTTWYSGVLPSGYSPMKQQGAIVLGTGGDNSNGSDGSFFEGVITSGEPSVASMDSIQTNIVSVGYSTSASSGNLIANGTYVIKSVYSGLAIGDPGSSDTNSTVMEQLTVTNDANQQWTVTNLGSNIITLKNGASGQMLDVDKASTANSALVDQYPANGNTNQQWQVISLGGGEYELTSVNSGKALDVDGGTKTSGTDIDQYTYNAKAWQQWEFVAP